MGRAGATNRGGVRDVLLVALTLSTGAVDAISWLVLGKVFSAFMTGNIAFLAFRTAGAEGPSVPRVLASLGGFGIGALVAARIVKPTRVFAGAVAGGLLVVHARIWAPVLPLTVSGVVIAVAARSPRATGLALPPARRAVVSGGLHPPGKR
jgi:hypothetical protein